MMDRLCKAFDPFHAYYDLLKADEKLDQFTRLASVVVPRWIHQIVDCPSRLRDLAYPFTLGLHVIHLAGAQDHAQPLIQGISKFSPDIIAMLDIWESHLASYTIHYRKEAWFGQLMGHFRGLLRQHLSVLDRQSTGSHSERLKDRIKHIKKLLSLIDNHKAEIQSATLDMLHNN